MSKNVIRIIYIFTFWMVLPFALFYSAHILDHRFAPVFPSSPFVTFSEIVIMVFSIPLLILSIAQFIKQSREFPISATPPEHLIQNGLYAVWRHPIYLFYTLLFIGIALILPSFSLLVIVMPVFIMIELIYIFNEEQYLIKRFGDRYIHYRQKTPLLLPVLPNILRLPVYTLFRIFFGYRVSGKENIPVQPPFFIVAAHKNYLDPFFIATAICFPIKFVTTFEVFRSPLSRFLFKKLNCLAKKRYCTDRPALRNLVRSIEDRWVIGIFPEGERSWTGWTTSFKPEVLNLLKRYKHIPVLPVQLSGNYMAWPRWAKKPVPSRVEVHFQKPIYINADRQLNEIEEQVKLLLPGHQPAISKSLKPRVKNINLVLYRCPVCRSFDSFTFERRNRFKCPHCQTVYTMQPDYRVQYNQNESMVLRTIEELYQQVKIKTLDITLLLDQGGIRSGPACISAEQGNRLVKLFSGQLLLEWNRLWFQDRKQSLHWPLNQITSVTIENNYKLQIYNRSETQLYQITFEQESALKWQDFILENMKKELGWVPNYR
jgi:1-acyl-sn-glycerol-3-phosphate acyltransferase